MKPGTPAISTDPNLTVGERVKLAAVLTFILAVFGVIAFAIVSTGTLGDIRDTPLDPSGWEVAGPLGVRRPALWWDMLHHKIKLAGMVAGCAALLVFYLVILLRVLLGRPTSIGRAMLRQLGSKQSFRFHTSEVTLDDDSKASGGPPGL